VKSQSKAEQEKSVSFKAKGALAVQNQEV